MPFTIAAFIAGVVFGAALGAFLAYVVLPANIVLRDAPPAYLRADPTGANVEYRDLYVARVAQRYSLGVQGGLADPAFTEAQESLGIASGDASPADALSMVNSAAQAANLENQRDGTNPDAGRFTLADANNMKSLSDRLTQIQGQPAVTPESVVAARRSALIYGVIGLLILGAFLVGALAALNAFLSRGNNATVTTTKTTTATYKAQPTVAGDGAAATFTPAASVDELPDVLIDVKTPPPTEPGLHVPASSVAAMAGAVTLQQRAASPVAGESLINSFTASFANGDDAFDEDFQINSSSGDLIGECGASIAERYGVDKPSKVTALGIWVFDKNDFQSTKSMLMTPFAYRDPAIHEKVKQLGEPVQARLGMFEVLTSTLRVEVEVRNLLMQPIGHDPDGYFAHVDLEFRVFKRPL